MFLGEHVTMNRRVALKFISRQMGKDQASLERFLAEARAVAALDHPNIVQAYNVDNEGDRYYIVMEYIDGLDLQRLVETEGPLEYGLAADYIRQAADGLAHAHARNMVHCDIKPSNLLVNPQGVVKILDMGLSRLIERRRGRPAARPARAGVRRLPLARTGPGNRRPRPPHRHLRARLHPVLPFDRPSAVSRGNAAGTHPQAPDASAATSGRIGPMPRPTWSNICVRMMAKRPADRIHRPRRSVVPCSNGRRQADPKAVVPLQLSEEEKVAGQEEDFASDPWWDTISAAPTPQQFFAAEERLDAGCQGGSPDA